MTQYINGFSCCTRTANGKSYRIPGTNRWIRVRSETAPLLLGFASEFHDKVQPLDTGILDDWGYFCRKVTGGSTPSFHAAGIAIDLNSTKHPYGRKNTFTPRQRATIRKLCKKYGLRWGGDYRSNPDEMHFEIIISRSAALALVKRLQSKPVKPTTKPTPAAKPRLEKLVYGGPQNSDTVLLQKRLNKVLDIHLETDGLYGPKTREAVADFQRSRHQNDPDGLMGEVTLARLFE